MENNYEYGDIFWADLRPATGSEQNGARPVLILSNNVMNTNSTNIMVAPMTRESETLKKGPFNIEYKTSEIVLDNDGVAQLKLAGHLYANKDGAILVNQSRAISKKRILGKVGRVKSASSVLRDVRNSLVDVFALDSCDVCIVPFRKNGLNCIKCGKLHKKKCSKCSNISPISYKFCPCCGKGL